MMKGIVDKAHCKKLLSHEMNRPFGWNGVWTSPAHSVPWSSGFLNVLGVRAVMLSIDSVRCMSRFLSKDIRSKPESESCHPPHFLSWLRRLHD